jgi:hypothetical protein
MGPLNDSGAESKPSLISLALSAAIAKLAPFALDEHITEQSKSSIAEVVRLLSIVRSDSMSRNSRLGNFETVAPSTVFVSGLSESEIFSWDFDILKVDTLPVVRTIVGSMFSFMFDFQELGIDVTKFAAYILAVQDSYNNNPFHNFRHCVCVTHFACMLSKPMGAREKLGLLQHFAVIFSAVVHDIDHPGNTNAFEVNSQSHRALIYNDQSVLENHHCSTAFRLFDREPLNFLGGLPEVDRRIFRKITVASILATDMSLHFNLTEEFNVKAAKGDWVIETPNDQLLFAKILVHAADLSNPVRQFSMTKRWAELISDEFNAQVDKEKILGLPVLPFMVTPDTQTLAKNEMNFCTFVVGPMWRGLAAYYTDLTHLTTQLDSNYMAWKSIQEECMRQKSTDI